MLRKLNSWIWQLCLRLFWIEYSEFIIHHYIFLNINVRFFINFQSNKPPISTSSSGSSAFLTSFAGSGFLASAAAGVAVVWAAGAFPAFPLLPCNKSPTFLPFKAFSKTLVQIGSTLKLAALTILANLTASIWFR